MRKEREAPVQISDRALEMIMRDVLDGLVDFSLESGFTPQNPYFEIIQIGETVFTPPSISKDDSEDNNLADILEFAPLKMVAN